MALVMMAQELFSPNSRCCLLLSAVNAIAGDESSSDPITRRKSGLLTTSSLSSREILARPMLLGRRTFRFSSHHLLRRKSNLRRRLGMRYLLHPMAKHGVTKFSDLTPLEFRQKYAELRRNPNPCFFSSFVHARTALGFFNPLQGDFPEVIEEYLEHGIMKCISFNRRGTLLAAGCSDGSCVVWDFETRGIAKELRDKDCVAAITSVCWSKNGHQILVSAADKSLCLWDVVKGEKIFRTTVHQTPLQARLHPGGGSSESTLCLVCPFSSAPMIVDLRNEATTTLPISLSDRPTGIPPPSRNKFSDGAAHFTPTAACFNKYGDLVYVGNSVGEILIIDHKENRVRGVIPISGNAVIKTIVFSRDGRYLLTNSSDRTIRIYDNLLPLKDSLKALDDIIHEGSTNEAEALKAVGSKCLSLFREFQDSITRVHWKAPCFSGDGEWVVGGSASKGEHKIYIWDRAGHLVKILEGPKEALMDLAWHPVHPIVVSVSLTGLVYIWAKDYTENWSAFAPDFKELEENEEYVEREDEFDLMPETEKVKESETKEDDEVDIITVEKDSAFSDSDISQDELCFLPADPCPDVPEQDIHAGSTSKLGDSKNSDSPLSEETGVAMNHDSNQIEGLENSGAEDTGNLKRRRKPSEKVLELQQAAQKVRKPLPKAKTAASSGKSSKSTKTKFGIEQEQEQDMMNHYADENGIDDD